MRSKFFKLGKKPGKRINWRVDKIPDNSWRHKIPDFQPLLKILHYLKHRIMSDLLSYAPIPFVEMLLCLFLGA
jgi:hypothetical protein